MLTVGYLSLLLTVVYESRIFITRISLTADDSVCFEYLQWNKKKYKKVNKQELTYKIRNSTNITFLNDRIYFYENNLFIIKQFTMASAWGLHDVNSLSENFKANGIRKVFGDNV